jgi:hypothetical protein
MTDKLTKYEVFANAIRVGGYEGEDGLYGAKEYSRGDVIELQEAHAKHYLDMGAIGKPGSRPESKATAEAQAEQDATIKALEEELAKAKAELAEAKKTTTTTNKPPAK